MLVRRQSRLRPSCAEVLDERSARGVSRTANCHFTLQATPPLSSCLDGTPILSNMKTIRERRSTGRFQIVREVRLAPLRFLSLTTLAPRNVRFVSLIRLLAAIHKRDPAATHVLFSRHYSAPLAIRVANSTRSTTPSRLPPLTSTTCRSRRLMISALENGR
jgi:hypothetical protein